MVDRYACQFLTPFGSDTISTIVQEDAIASEGIARQGRVQIGREREQKRADGNDAGYPSGEDQDYHTHDQSRLFVQVAGARADAPIGHPILSKPGVGADIPQSRGAGKSRRPCVDHLSSTVPCLICDLLNCFRS